MKYNMQHINCTDVILIRFRLNCTCTGWHGTVRHMVEWQKKYVKGEQSTLRRYQMCRRHATNDTRKEGLKNYADVIYAKLDW